MKRHQLAAALAAASLLATLPGFGATWATEPWARGIPRACTPEAQKCLEKLEARLYLRGRSHDQIGFEQALLEMQETDPECALLLRNASWHDL
jgi:hypothetical protein